MNNHLEETELLIQLVRDRPALYDRSRADFKDPAYKQFMWQEVGDLMGCMCNYTFYTFINRSSVLDSLYSIVIYYSTGNTKEMDKPEGSLHSGA